MEKSNEGRSEENSQMREMAVLWVKSQAAITAFIASNVRDRHHAEDLVQETASVVAAKFHQFDPSRPFTPWVLSIARNLILKYYRSEYRNPIVLNEEALKSVGTALERVEELSEDRRQALRTCLERVRGRNLRLLRMRYDENLRLKEIAEALGISASTVSVMLFRVRASLERCIRGKIVKTAGS